MNYKKINKEYFVTILDRLTRFEPAYNRYKRVFDDIISKFLVDVELKKNLTLEDEIKIVEEIIKNSLNEHTNIDISNQLIEIENQYFIKNKLSTRYLNSKIDYISMYKQIQNTKNLPKNLNIFKPFLENLSNSGEIVNYRKNNSNLFPISKIVLCEGQTEFVLLETIFKKFGYDFSKNGILVLEAGGKNKVAKKYYEMIEYCKVPFFILLDKDAVEIKELILPKLREIDKLYLLSSGEFEDLIPIQILMNVINYIHKNELMCCFDDFDINKPTVKNLEEIYRKYGFGEFKKAHFAQELKNYIEKTFNISDFNNSEISQIVKALQEL